MLVGVPWAPELFSAPALQQVLDKYQRERMRLVPFFDGLMAGEVDALVASFAGVPEVHHPVRGRIRGEAAFRRYVAEVGAWMAAHHVEVEPVDILLTPHRGVEEVLVRLDGDGGRVGVPLALAADHDPDGRIAELRLYFSTLALTGHHASRPPLLQPDGHLRVPGDVEAALRAHYARLFSGGADPVVEACTVTDDGHCCALEYNLVAPGRAPAPGLFVHGREHVATRVYDDTPAPG
jgi:hypothetical protein